MKEQPLYTPTDSEVEEAIAEWMWSRRMFRSDLAHADGAELQRWLSSRKSS